MYSGMKYLIAEFGSFGRNYNIIYCIWVVIYCIWVETVNGFGFEECICLIKTCVLKLIKVRTVFFIIQDFTNICLLENIYGVPGCGH